MNERLEFNAPAEGNIFVCGAQHGVCVTGDNNIIYQILLPDRAELASLIDQIRTGTLKVEHVQYARPVTRNSSSQIPNVQASSPPLIDVTCFNAIQSLFLPGPKDPWAYQILEKFIDFYIWNDCARYPLIITPKMGSERRIRELPGLMQVLMRRDSTMFSEASHIAKEPLVLSSDYLHSSFEAFMAFARNNQDSLRRFVALHREPWIKCQLRDRIDSYGGYFYSVRELAAYGPFQAAVAKLGIAEDDLFYGFDVALKYLAYGELAGQGTYYLSHPIRELQAFPCTSREVMPCLSVPLLLGRSIARIASSMTQDEFTSFLHEARGLVRELEMPSLKPNAVGEDARRELASRLRLPARLSRDAKAMGLLATIGGAMLTVPILGGAAAIGGIALVLASGFWNARLARAVSSAKWAQWAVTWEGELGA